MAPALALGGNRPAFWAPMAAIALGLAIWRGGEARPPGLAAPLALAALLWAAFQALSGLSVDPGATWRAIARVAAYFALFLAAAALARELRAGQRIMRAVALFVATLSAFGLGAWFWGASPLLGALEAYPAALEATFVNRNAYALYAGLGVLAALAALQSALAPDGAAPSWRPALRRLSSGGWLWLVAALISGAALFATGSRGGAAATVLGLAAYWAAQAPARRAVMIALGGALLAGLAIAAVAILARGDGVVEETSRLEIHRLVLTAIGDAPLFGQGFGGFQDAFRPYASADWRWGDWDHAHQIYLETVFELGLPAGLALIGAAALAGLSALRAARQRRRAAPVAALGFAALVACGAQGLVDFGLAIPAVAALLALLLGAAHAQGRP